MSRQSWRKHGGLGKMEKMNNLTVTSVVTDTFTVREIAQEFQVSALSVYGDANIRQNVNVLQDVSCNRNLFIGENAYFGDTINMGTVPYVTLKGQFVNNERRIGINNSGLPTATLDITGDSISSIVVNTSSTTNRNILCKQVNDCGIALSSDTVDSSIHFYNALGDDTGLTNSTSNPGASIKYLRSGQTLSISECIDTQVLSKLLVSNRHTPTNLFNETAIIYDISAGLFNSHIYNNGSVQGNALSLVAQDNSANTLLNITTPNKNGVNIAGGSYPGDVDRSMGTLDVSNVMYNVQTNPAQMIVSGKDKSRFPKTIGFNTHSPLVDKYSMDINGVINLSNNDIKIVAQPTFEVMNISYYKDDPNYAVMVGNSYTGIPNSGLSLKYQALYTHDGGITWNTSEIGALIDKNFIPKTVYVKDASHSLIATTTGNFIFYSNDGGKTYIIKGSLGTYSYNAIYISPENKVIIADFGGTIYGLVNIDNFDFQTGATTPVLSTDFTITGGQLNFDFQTLSMDGSGNDLFLLSPEEIRKYNCSTNIVSSSKAKDTNVKYVRLRAYNELIVIAVGKDIITYTHNGGTSWQNVVVDGSMNDVYIQSPQKAIAVGDNSKIYYSQDSFTTWKQLSLDQVNSNGLGFLLMNNLKLSAIFMPSNDRLIVNTIINPYSPTIGGSYIGTGDTNILNVYVPDVLNRTNNSVIDLYGNVDISGDIIVNDKGKLRTTNETIEVFNETVKTINIGGQADTIVLGDASTNIVIAGNLGGELTQTELVVDNDSTLNGTLLVKQDASFNQTVNITGVTTMNDLILNTDASMNAATVGSTTTQTLIVNELATFNNNISQF